MSFKFARCGHCRKFWVLSKVSIASCPSCLWHSVRCHGCGGRDRTVRGLLMHVLYWAGAKAGGHDAKLIAKVAGGGSAPQRSKPSESTPPTTTEAEAA